MAFEYKEFPLNLDLVEGTSAQSSNKKISLSQRDIGVSKILFSLTFRNVAYPIPAGAKVRLFIKRYNSGIVMQDQTPETGAHVIVTDAENGKVEVLLNSDSIANAGQAEAQIEIELAPGKIMTSQKFSFFIEAALGADGKVISGNDIPLLDKAIAAGEKLKDTDLDAVISVTSDVQENAASIDILNGLGVISKNFKRNVPENDDTGRLQRALDSVPNGKKLFLTESSYTIGSTLNGKTGTSIIGLGVKETIINNNGSGYALSISGTGVLDARRYTCISALTIQGTSAAAGGIKLSFNGEFFVLDQLRILGHINGVGIDLPDSFSGVISNVHVSQCINSTGIRMYGNNASTGQATFLNVVVAYSKYGIEIGEAYNTTTAQIIDSVNFIGCIFQHCSASSVRVGANVRNSKFQTCHFERGLDESPTAIGLEIAGQTAIMIDVDTCWFYDFNKAIKVDKATKCTGRNINFQDCQYGIEFTSNAVDCTFQNVRFSNPNIALIQDIIYAGSNNRVFDTRDIVTIDSIRYLDSILAGNNSSANNTVYASVPGGTFLIDPNTYKLPKGKTLKFKLVVNVSSGVANDTITTRLYNVKGGTEVLNGSVVLDSYGLGTIETTFVNMFSVSQWLRLEAKNNAANNFTVRRAYLVIECQ